MEVIIDKGCGLDVHKQSVVACIMGKDIKKDIQTFGTYTSELVSLKKWLKDNGITHIAMESTGVYWKPIFNILEDEFEILLVNARYIKNVPGRKTDVSDSEWICKLLRAGLLRGSFIPPRDIRELRDLTRYEQKLVNNISSEKNRIQKVLEDANIKLSSVVSNMFGVTATKIVEELLKGELTPQELCQFAKGRLAPKKEEIIKAVEGKLTSHHKLMIEASLEHIKAMQNIIDTIDIQINKLLKKYNEEYELLQTIPGVKEKAATAIIAEIGTNMDQFPTEDHLCSWAGIAPGNNESAGKKKSGKITKGSKALKNILVQSAWAASKTKDTYLSSKYKSLVGRRGKKRALIAVAHKILQIAYFIIKDKQPYKELGGNYLELRKEQTIVKGLKKRFEKLGYKVKIQKEEQDAA
jgi:transposase